MAVLNAKPALQARARSAWALQASRVTSLHQQGWQGQGVRVGLLDSGIATGHPAFARKLHACVSFSLSAAVQIPSDMTDQTGHGSHTAGILVGSDHSGECFGIAPEAHLVVAKVLEHGDVIARLLSGMDWMLSQSVDVLCLPFGIRSSSPIFEPFLNAFAARDVLIVASIGNDGVGRARIPGNSPKVVSVGAHDRAGRPLRESGSLNDSPYHCRKPELLAPGDAIRSCAPDGGLASRSGTSMACAHVAGVAALLRGAYPQASARQVAGALLAGARPNDRQFSHRSVHGHLDAASSFAMLGEDRNRSTERQTREPSLPHWFDPRLKRQLDESHDDNWLRSVLCFGDSDSADRTLSAVLPTEFGGLQLRSWSLLHGNMRIVLAPARFQRALVDAPEVCMANAVDVDWV